MKGFFPLPYRSHLAEPEGIRAALERPDRVNPAAMIIQPAGAVRFLGNAETRFNRLQMRPDQIGYGYFQKFSQNLDFPPIDADSGIKKIPAMIRIVRVAFHMGFDL